MTIPSIQYNTIQHFIMLKNEMESYVRLRGRRLKNVTYLYIGVSRVKNCQNHPFIINKWPLTQFLGHYSLWVGQKQNQLIVLIVIPCYLTKCHVLYHKMKDMLKMTKFMSHLKNYFAENSVCEQCYIDYVFFLVLSINSSVL